VSTLWFVLLVGCSEGVAPGSFRAVVQDRDGDGIPTAADCDDDNVQVYPGAAEACDGIDNNCNGEIDEGVTQGRFADADGDGFGDPLAALPGCDEDEGVVFNALDCDDTNPDILPGADEICDAIDNDCDGAIDEGVTMIVYPDGDGDGAGDPTLPMPACEVQTGFAARGDDCDDGDEAVHPLADERCDGIDNDCDLLVDEDDAVDAPTWYEDLDEDGYGEAEVIACEAPPRTSPLGGDCNDGDVTINPGILVDRCDNLIDDDCDGLVDNDCPVEHCGPVNVDETWEPGPVHLVTCDVYVAGSTQPVLEIADGALVLFEPGTELRSGHPGFAGELRMNGENQGITLMSAAAQPAPGDWRGLVYTSWDVGSRMRGVTVAHAGGGDAPASIEIGQTNLRIADSIITEGATNGIHVGRSGTVEVHDTELSGHAGNGLSTGGGYLAVGDGSTFTGNLVTGNGGAPMLIRAADVAQLSASSRFSGNHDDRIIVTQGTVDTNARWEALDVPYFLQKGLAVGGGSGIELVLSDGVVLQFAWNEGISVGNSFGGLRVEGTTAGVRMESEQGDAGQPGDWLGLTFALNATVAEIEGLTLRHGGGNGVGGINVAGVDLEMTASAVVDNAGHGIFVRSGSSLGLRDSEIRGNLGDGIRAEGDLSELARPSFTDNEVTGNGGVPLGLPAISVAEVDATNQLTGNGDDRIVVFADSVTRGGTWLDHGLPLSMTGLVRIGGAGQPVITIDAGVELFFAPEAGFQAGLSGSGGLRALGTTGAPVRFDSAQPAPAPGDWQGIEFWGNCVDSDVVLSNVEVRHAGANGKGAVQFAGCDGMVSDSMVVGSSSYGVYRQNGAAPTLMSVTYMNNAQGDVF